MQQWQVGPVPTEYLYSNSAAQHPNDMHPNQPYQNDMSRRPDFTGYAQQQNPVAQQHQPHPQHQQQQHAPHQQQHQQHPSQLQHQQHPSHIQHAQHPQLPPHQHQPQQQPQHQTTPVQPSMTIPQPAPPQPQQPTPTQQPARAPRSRKRQAVDQPVGLPPTPSQPTARYGQQTTPQQAHQQIPQVAQQPYPTQIQQQVQQQQQRHGPGQAPPPVQAPVVTAPGQASVTTTPAPPTGSIVAPPQAAPTAPPVPNDDATATPQPPPAKKSRTNTPWTPAEELRLKQMRDAGNSWAEIAKTFPTRTEGSVKKHWYKDMHYAEFAENESQALLNAIKEYENNKWKTIGQKVGKPAKACEQYAKEHFPDLFNAPKTR